MECLKKFRGILLGYEINVFSDYKNLVYAATLSKYQRVMHWRLILEHFGPNIKHIFRVENIVDGMISVLSSTSVDNYKPRTRKDKRRKRVIFNY